MPDNLKHKIIKEKEIINQQAGELSGFQLRSGNKVSQDSNNFSINSY